ncbi:MAG: DUF4153 domain-containing protein [Devosia sp.]
MSIGAWLNWLAPDFVATGRRFPLAIGLALLTTAVGIMLINAPYGMRDAFWERLWLGFATAAVFAVAGAMFSESRPTARLTGLVLRYVLPLAVVALVQVRDIDWFVPWLLPAIGVLWLSVSPFTLIGRGEAREDAQNRFWWVNHQAVATAAIATVGFLIIGLGLYAIERSLTTLFGLSVGDLFYKWVLPFTGMFLVPVYWLSTLPRVTTFRKDMLEQPDFTSTAIGFLGQFVLVPLLLIYGLILLAYTVQIVVTQQLPEGMIGWMVLGFVVTGAATWLVLHPPFMRGKALTTLFRRVWFWMTLVPLALFFFAVEERVSAYGLTTDRVLLIAGGVWAAVLAALFLLRRGDIRLIPGVAGALLLLISIGPWNYVHLPIAQQGLRLEALLAAPGANGVSFPPEWDAGQVADAGSAMAYLYRTDEGRARLNEALAPHGLDASVAKGFTPTSVMEQLGYDWPVPRESMVIRLVRDRASQIDVSATPIYLGQTNLFAYVQGRDTDAGIDSEAGVQLTVSEDGSELRARLGDTETVVDMAAWLARQPDKMTDEPLGEPWVDFALAGLDYRIVVNDILATRQVDGTRAIQSLSGELFASAVRE